MTKQPITPLASAERRAGIYERDDEVTSLLWYSTHSILDVPPGQMSTGGKARDRDLVIPGDDVSAHHFLMQRRSSGLWVTDDASTNGLAYEGSGSRTLGLALKPLFDDKRDMGEGFLLKPGMTFVVGAEPYRFLALDAAMRAHHPTLIEILGREDEVRSASEAGETPGPADLILAADGPGHLLITGQLGCEHEELARIIHKISKRRRQPIEEIDQVPGDRKAQNALLKHKARRGTLVLHLAKNRNRLDPAFVSGMFSPGYQIRVIVTARTPNQARRALGHQYWRTLMHAALCPMALRRAAIHRLLTTREDKLSSDGLTAIKTREIRFTVGMFDVDKLSFTGDSTNAAPASSLTLIHEAAHAVSTKPLDDASAAQMTAAVEVNKATDAGNAANKKTVASRNVAATGHWNKFKAADQKASEPLVNAFDDAHTAITAFRDEHDAAKMAPLEAPAVAAVKARDTAKAGVPAANPAHAAYAPAIVDQDAYLRVCQTLLAKRQAHSAAATKADNLKDPKTGRSVRLQAFVDFVTANNIEPVTKYAKDNWPAKPGEFYSEALALWHGDPTFFDSYSNVLKKWFDDGKHLQ